MTGKYRYYKFPVMDAFEEEKHPRDHGKFTSGGGSTVAATHSTRANEIPGPGKFRKATPEDIREHGRYIEEHGFKPRTSPVHKSRAQEQMHKILEGSGYKYYGTNDRGGHSYIYPQVSGSTSYMPKATVNKSGGWSISAGNGMHGTGMSHKDAVEMLKKYPPHQPSRN